jgi:hypothetical protein
MTEHTESDALADYWREHVDAWRAAGDSQAAYCKSRELVYHRFVYWRRKFEGSTGRREKQQEGNGFATVTCDRSIDTGLTLSLPNGLVLRGICAGNVSVVRQLLDQL